MESNGTSLAEKIEQGLLDRHGPMIGDDALRTALGFPSKAAFRQALSRHRIDIPIFSLPQRRGKFALVKDVAEWLAKQRERAVGGIESN